jgi:hypothetical protein
MSVLSLNCGCVYPVVLLMGTDKSDEHDTLLVPDSNDQSIIVTLKIENDSVISNKTGISIHGLNGPRIFPGCMLGVVIPCLEWLSYILVLLPKFSELFSGYDSHLK